MGKQMTVRELITWLESLNIPDAVVKMYDGDTEQDEPVTGAVYDTKELTFHTDDPS